MKYAISILRFFSRERREDIKILTDFFFDHFRIKEKTNLKSISQDIYKMNLVVKKKPFISLPNITHIHLKFVCQK